MLVSISDKLQNFTKHDRLGTANTLSF